MKAALPAAAIFLLSTSLLLAQPRSQPQLFIAGTVKWISGVPATGLQVKLVRAGRVMATTYTNSAGRYAFFRIQGRPAEYSLQVYGRNALLKELRLPNLPAGSWVPDVVVE